MSEYVRPLAAPGALAPGSRSRACEFTRSGGQHLPSPGLGGSPWKRSGGAPPETAAFFFVAAAHLGRGPWFQAAIAGAALTALFDVFEDAAFPRRLDGTQTSARRSVLEWLFFFPTVGVDRVGLRAIPGPELLSTLGWVAIVMLSGPPVSALSPAYSIRQGQRTGRLCLPQD